MTNSYIIGLYTSDNCNYNCQHCFLQFKAHILPFSDCKKIVDRLIDNLPIERINIACGEPLIYRDLDKLIDYIHSKNTPIEIITNGLLLNEEMIANWKNKVDIIGISIDALSKEKLIEIGRVTPLGEYLKYNELVRICKYIKTTGIKLKINTVVTKLNLNEDLNDFISTIKPDRWKIFKMKPFENSNFSNKDLVISDEEYEQFLKRHSTCEYIAERKIKPSIFIDNEANMIIVDGDDNYKFANVLEADFENQVKDVDLYDFEKIKENND